MKPRRDITLGEMQDECKKHGNCMMCNVKHVCVHMIEKPYTDIDLTDPPRFNEQQMALLNGLWEIGARKLTTFNVFDSAYYIIDKEEHSIGTILISVFGRAESPLDLAELLGKDGAE